MLVLAAFAREQMEACCHLKNPGDSNAEEFLGVLVLSLCMFAFFFFLSISRAFATLFCGRLKTMVRKRQWKKTSRPSKTPGMESIWGCVVKRKPPILEF